ncbi:MAG: BamA/TamA family outer membrane protein [Deltaproteobacteria bacterium]|nr:BamA/TamA family outer membrane protein [Deltaproteobacteria bacterium]
MFVSPAQRRPPGPPIHRAPLAGLALLLLALTLPGPALADQADDERRYLDRQEFSWLPLLGGDSDFGYGAGIMLSLADFRFPYEPYRYRLEAVALALFKLEGGSRLLVPYQDYTFRATFPQLIFDPLRLIVGARYVRNATLLYPGLGNASQPDPALDFDQQRYSLAQPHVFLQLGFALPDPWRLKLGVSYGRDLVRIPSDGAVARDLASSSDWLRAELRGTGHHDALIFDYALGLDTRDNETVASKGYTVDLLFQHAPAIQPRIPLFWLRTNLSGRLFLPLYKDVLVLASRLQLDLLFGDPPFYELARAGNRWAIGSAFGLRGIPGQRYYGRYKAIANLELRTQLFRFEAWNKRWRIGLVAFGDAGRVWADVRSRPEIGTGGDPLHYGVGGGLRLQQGEVFVVRADVAWSPQANPVGFYFTAGHLF